MRNDAVKVVLIEDDPIWAINVEAMLENTPYEVVGVANSFPIIEAMIEGLKPDILVSDIVISNNHVFDFLTNKGWNNFRIIFITSHADDFFFTKSKNFSRSSFLVKPFHKSTLISALEILLKAFPLEREKQGRFLNFTGKLQKNKKVFLNEISHIKAMGNYSAVFTLDNKKYVKKNTLNKLKVELDDRFLQVHKSHIVNIDYINRLNLGKDYMVVNNEDIPIGRAFRKNLDEYIEREN